MWYMMSLCCVKSNLIFLTCEDGSYPDDLRKADDSREEGGHQDQCRQQRAHPQPHPQPQARVHFCHEHSDGVKSVPSEVFKSSSEFKSKDFFKALELRIDWKSLNDQTKSLLSFILFEIEALSFFLFFIFFFLISSQLQKSFKIKIEAEVSRSTLGQRQPSTSTSTSKSLSAKAALKQEKTIEEGSEEWKNREERKNINIEGRDEMNELASNVGIILTWKWTKAPKAHCLFDQLEACTEKGGGADCQLEDISKREGVKKDIEMVVV